jgi:multidrug resistance efflux pump
MATVLKQGPAQDPKQIPEQTSPAREPIIVPTAAPKSGKRRVVLPIVLLLVALGAFWAYKQWSYGRVHESTDDAAVDGHHVPGGAQVSGYVQAAVSYTQQTLPTKQEV